jgi:hypothetical protein
VPRAIKLEALGQRTAACIAALREEVSPQGCSLSLSLSLVLSSSHPLVLSQPLAVEHRPPLGHRRPHRRQRVFLASRGLGGG